MTVRDTDGVALSTCFADLEDPRIERCRRHELVDILVITICAVICDADDWTEIAAFGAAKETWFKTFLDLPNGIPSHDTFGRVFARLDPVQFEACFLTWATGLGDVLPGSVIAVDGKTVRRSHDRTAGKGPIHVVSAWATEHNLVLGQVKVDDKSNEITAIPALLEALLLTGRIVTIDAMGCQKDIARQIVDRGGAYVLALKDNQPDLAEDVALLFTDVDAGGPQVFPHDHRQQVEKGHGRIETRDCWTITDPALLAAVRGHEQWAGLQGLIRIRAQRQVGQERSVENRYYLTSLPVSAEQGLSLTRIHWRVENSLHWVLDVAFREDDSRVRMDAAAENFAILRRIALNLLKQDTTKTYGIKARRKTAGWDHTYLLHLLQPLVQ